MTILKHSRLSWLTLLLALVVVLAACGGDDTGAADSESAAGDTGGEGAPSGTEDGGSSDDDVQSSGDDGEAVAVTSERPEWLPVWLFLPEGIDIDASLITPGTGQAGLTGSVPDSDADELYNDATFMVQTAGYIITEEFEAGGRGFTAEHTSDGSSVIFTVADVNEGVHQISWQFEDFLEAGVDAGNRQPARGAGDIGLEPPPRRGNLTISVTNPRVSDRIDGACDGSNSQVQFLSDDGLTKFIVFTGDVVGAAGEVTADFDGEDVTWVAAADSEQSASQTDRTSAYYEGDFIQGDDIAFAVVQIACDE